MSKNHELSLPIKNQNRQPAKAARLLPTIARSIDGQTASKTNDESDVDMIAIVQTLLRRRAWIYVCTATMLAVAALVCIFMTPKYRAESKLQILKQDLSGLSVSGSTNLSGGGDSDAMEFNLNLQTQLAVLKSDTLARQVIKELNLADTKEFGPGSPLKSIAARYLHAVPSGDPAPEASADAVLKKFKANLTVDSVSGTRLITVGYTHPDAKTAAKIVNQLVSDFVEYNFQTRHDATTKATDWLGRQMVDLKSEVEKTQERAVQLQKDSGIFGEDEHHNVVVTRLEQLNNEVTSAEATRVVKEAVYNLARNGNPELLAGMLGVNTEAADPGAVNSLPLLNNLRQQEASLNAEYADASSKYGPEYPKLVQIRERLTAVRSSIQTELGKVVGRAKSEYELAASREAAARKSFSEQKAIASRMNDKAINYMIAKHEAESSRGLYDHLLEKLKEADVLAGLRSSELQIVDAAAVPARPAKPNVPLYLAFGVLAGMTLGVVCVFVVDNTDRSIRNPEQIENTTYVPVLGVIPDAALLPGTGGKNRLKAQKKDGPKDTAQTDNSRLLSLRNSGVAEAFRALRTSLLLSQPDDPAKVLMVTSGMAQEGKSFTSLNLAAALAYNGSKVLLVDADLRRGTLSKVLKQNTGAGLSQVLSGGTDPEAYRQLHELPGLTFLPAGAPSPCPSELLGSQRMTAMIERWREQYAYVLIDTPPVLPVTDAVVLSPNADAVIVVVRFGVTNQQSIVRTIRALQDVQAKRVGVLVNAMDVRSPDYYHYSGSYGYDGYGEEDSGEFHSLVPPSAEPNLKGETA